MKLGYWFTVFLEFHLIIMPVLLSLLYNDYISSIISSEILCIFCLSAIHFIKTNEFLCYFSQTPSETHYSSLNNSIHFNFVTKYRSLLQIATCVTILAVDFRLFPRKFCKVEEQGVSLMDCGTGSALFSLALVSRQLREKNKRILVRLIRAISSCFPLFFIGLLRMLMIKQADYQVNFQKNMRFLLCFIVFFYRIMCRNMECIGIFS